MTIGTTILQLLEINLERHLLHITCPVQLHLYNGLGIRFSLTGCNQT